MSGGPSHSPGAGVRFDPRRLWNRFNRDNDNDTPSLGSDGGLPQGPRSERTETRLPVRPASSEEDLPEPAVSQPGSSSTARRPTDPRPPRRPFRTSFPGMAVPSRIGRPAVGPGLRRTTWSIEHRSDDEDDLSSDGRDDSASPEPELDPRDPVALVLQDLRASRRQPESSDDEIEKPWRNGARREGGASGSFSHGRDPAGANAGGDVGNVVGEGSDEGSGEDERAGLGEYGREYYDGFYGTVDRETSSGAGPSASPASRALGDIEDASGERERSPASNASGEDDLVDPDNGSSTEPKLGGRFGPPQVSVRAKYWDREEWAMVDTQVLSVACPNAFAELSVRGGDDYIEFYYSGLRKSTFSLLVDVAVCKHDLVEKHFSGPWRWWRQDLIDLIQFIDSEASKQCLRMLRQAFAEAALRRRMSPECLLMAAALMNDVSLVLDVIRQSVHYAWKVPLGKPDRGEEHRALSLMSAAPLEYAYALPGQYFYALNSAASIAHPQEDVALFIKSFLTNLQSSWGDVEPGESDDEAPPGLVPRAERPLQHHKYPGIISRRPIKGPVEEFLRPEFVRGFSADGYEAPDGWVVISDDLSWSRWNGSKKSVAEATTSKKRRREDSDNSESPEGDSGGEGPGHGGSGSGGDDGPRGGSPEPEEEGDSGDNAGPDAGRGSGGNNHSPGRGTTPGGDGDSLRGGETSDSSHARSDHGASGARTSPVDSASPPTASAQAQRPEAGSEPGPSTKRRRANPKPVPAPIEGARRSRRVKGEAAELKDTAWGLQSPPQSKTGSSTGTEVVHTEPVSPPPKQARAKAAPKKAASKKRALESEEPAGSSAPAAKRTKKTTAKQAASTAKKATGSRKGKERAVD